ncbi:hypothetical protein BLNAU_9 [Blattamonas nauphoetae]|uniref:C3H1-type domain-containing protein n=1 Tax=Blattamonas nauphoetae TaxID=2049346 RepID=A0ABQ9YLR9_9EUKA|nr:hypothetical protein BLNAU_9 [Blattamonas nauphoetae]
MPKSMQSYQPKQTSSRQSHQPRKKTRAQISARYKTELCRHFCETGFCIFGDRCEFAHGDSELRHIEKEVPNTPCPCYHAYPFICYYGTRCRYKHKDPDDWKTEPVASVQSESSFKTDSLHSHSNADPQQKESCNDSSIELLPPNCALSEQISNTDSPTSLSFPEPNSPTFHHFFSVPSVSQSFSVNSISPKFPLEVVEKHPPLLQTPISLPFVQPISSPREMKNGDNPTKPQLTPCTSFVPRRFLGKL